MSTPSPPERTPSERTRLIPPTLPSPRSSSSRSLESRTHSQAHKSLRQLRLLNRHSTESTPSTRLDCESTTPTPTLTLTPSRNSISTSPTCPSTLPSPSPPTPSHPDYGALTPRPRSIRSLASYTSPSPSPSPSLSPSPSPSPSTRRTSKPRHRLLLARHFLRTHLLTLSVALLTLLCIYASFAQDFMGDVEAAVSCSTCVALLAPLQALAKVGDDAFVGVFVGFCEKLGIEDPDVCLGAVGSQAPILAHDLRSIALASPAAKSFCSTVFGLCPLQKTRQHTVELQPERDEVGMDEFEVRKGRGERVRRSWKTREGQRERGDKEMGARREPFQVVHISDVHVDRQYTEGASTDCSKVICCRNYGPEYVGEGVQKPAGKYGHKKCDTPPSLVDSMLEAVERVAPTRAFTIFTGDVVESAVWAVDEPGVTSDLHLWNEDLRFRNLSRENGRRDGLEEEDEGGAKRGIVGRGSPSYPTIGNHDIAPVNAFPRLPSSTSTSSSPSTLSPALARASTSAQWAYTLLSRDWRRWIGNRAAKQVRDMSGCYSRVHPGTKLRMVSLNTGLWYKQNFWLYDSSIPVWDPNGILTWLAEELDEAEREGERVWIIGHMPPGKVDAMRDQSNYAHQIFLRYHETIAAHFYGHSHVDEFEVGYERYGRQGEGERREEEARMVGFIGGAVTPTSGNPVFRVYDVDPDTYEVMDFTPYYANKSSPTYQISPTWEPYYSARSAYSSYFLNETLRAGMNWTEWPQEASLNATFWHRVTEVFERDEAAFQLFNTRLSRGGKIEDCSGPVCRKNTICMLRSMRSEDNCAVIQPGLSFKDQKRDTDAVTEPQRDEEASPSLFFNSSPNLSLDTYSLRHLSSPPSSPASLHVLDWPEERFSQSRQHDYFACEGPGVGSLLRNLGSGVALPRFSVAEEGGSEVQAGRRGEADFSGLRAFQRHVDEELERHRQKRKFWQRWRT